MMRLELLRLWRARRPFVALGAIAFFLALMLLGFYTYAESRTGGQSTFRYTFENRSYFNGLTFALYAFYFGFLLLLPVFVATEGGAQVAGDTESGALRLLLTRPISRARIFFTKFAVAAGLAAALSAGLLAAALGVGLLVVGWGDLDLYPGVLQMTSRHQHLPQGIALQRFGLVWPFATLALLAPLSLALWIATWVKSPVNAVGSAFAAYLVMYVVSQIHFFAELRPWLFTSSMASWRGLFQEEIDWHLLAREAARLVGFSALFLALAFRRFRLREER